MVEAHIGQKYDSSRDSSSGEDEKVATMTIHNSSSTPRLFNNLPNDGDSPHNFLMEKGEKVKSKPSPI
jgi:hypothetical protein